MNEDEGNNEYSVGTTESIPQPWTATHESLNDFLLHAYSQEESGSRLVVEVWLNGYADPMDDGSSWIVERLEYFDWRTGQHIWGYDPEATNPDGQLDGFFVIERRLAETAWPT